MKSFKEIWPTARFYGLFALAYFAFTSIAFAQYYIPSASMRPTLEVGDRILVNKFAYGWSRYSLPILIAERVPLEGRLFARTPKRGDVIVFRRPDEPIVLIKRVVGLPGDIVRLRDGVVFINGEPAALADETPVLLDEAGRTIRAERFTEILPQGPAHAIYDQGTGPADDFGPYIVPEDCFLALGDNRDASADSRFWGCVPMANLVGRAETIAWTLAWRHPDPHGTRNGRRLWRGL